MPPFAGMASLFPLEVFGKRHSLLTAFLLLSFALLKQSKQQHRYDLPHQHRMCQYGGARTPGDKAAGQGRCENTPSALAYPIRQAELLRGRPQSGLGLFGG
jgi:hypothetical protein